jgi:Holliday junction resolvasome RuvABC endonuclease subunit
MGVDPPASRNLGWCVFDVTAAPRLEQSGIYRLQHSGDARLRDIKGLLSSVFRDFEGISTLVLEKSIVGDFGKVTIEIAEGAGVMKLFALESGIEIVEVSPTDVRRMLLGEPFGTKGMINSLVKDRFFRFSSVKSLGGPTWEHRADAIGLVVTHLLLGRISVPTTHSVDLEPPGTTSDDR